jgi:O-methyltransferase
MGLAFSPLFGWYKTAFFGGCLCSHSPNAEFISRETSTEKRPSTRTSRARFSGRSSHEFGEYSELPTEILFNLYSAARYIADANIAGDFVECGVHLGGSIMMMEHALLLGDNQPGRRIFALDTFSGFVRRTEGLDVDIETGAAACIPSEGVDDYTEGSFTNMRSVGFDKLHIIKGDVFETIPTLDTKSISLLRLDTDTYDTTKFELEHLYDYVVPGGVVIVDDYGYTFGCKKAVDDFVASRPILLQRINRNVRAWVKVA